MRQHRTAAIALESPPESRAQNDRTRQRDESANGVDHSGSCEVMKTGAKRREEISSAAHGRQPAVRSPRPVTNDRVDETGNADAVEKVSDKPRSTDHRTRRDGRARVCKSKLENPDGEECYAGGFVSRRCVLQEKPVMTDESVAMREHKSKTDRVEENAAKAGIHHTLYEDVHGFSRTTETSFQHGESNLHAEYQKRRN